MLHNIRFHCYTIYLITTVIRVIIFIIITVIILFDRLKILTVDHKPLP